MTSGFELQQNRIQNLEEVYMEIRLIYNGETSLWRPHSRQQHQALMQNPPDGVETHICDFYSDSPDGIKTKIVTFELFDMMARQFPLEEAARRKQDKRNLSSKLLADDVPNEMDIEKLFLVGEERQKLFSVVMQLTPTQRARVTAYYVKRLTFRQIADSEGVSEKSIRESINAAIKKIKKFL